MTNDASHRPSLPGRDWILAVVLLLSVVLLYRAFPRYEWHTVSAPQLLRIDRWTGKTQLGVVSPQWGRWVSYEELNRDWAAKRTAAK
jgi:hypothetical protein